MLRRFWCAIRIGLVASALSCGANRNRGGLKPPRDAPAWDDRYGAAFDDEYTRERLELTGRAPNDVLDQELFSNRLGFSHIIAVVRVKQVWSRGRYQGSQNQFVDIELEQVLMGQLPRNTRDNQILRVTGQEQLPAELHGQEMLLFLRWAPKEKPAFRHHLMAAEDELVAFVEGMVAHAKREGVLGDRGQIRKGRKSRNRQERKEKSPEQAEQRVTIDGAKSEDPKPKSTEPSSNPEKPESDGNSSPEKP